MKDIAIFLYSKSNLIAKPWANAGVECHLFDTQEGINCENIVHHVGDIRKQRKELGRLCRENNCILIGSFTPCTDMAVCGSKHFEKKALQDAMFWAKAMELVFIGLDIAEYFDIPYFIENPKTVLGTLLGRKPDFKFHPWQYGAYLPECHQHSLFPDIYPPRDAYPKETWLWIGNGLNIPEKKTVTPVGNDYPGWKKLGGKSEKTKEIRSVTPEGFARALFQYNFEGMDFSFQSRERFEYGK